ncbi:unnamed protein product [Cylicostephanus goldi]|uniref:Uncharacterized protein n=1 Tax=Cylicostephanus goldi TaxID=71465 RepID=A0A3P7Q3B4_CYLGO|nr:unnamed protein product [Cylicostephanus goldi]
MWSVEPSECNGCCARIDALLQMSSRTTLVPGNRLGNCLYQLDAMASICIGAAWLTFPKWLLHRQVVVPLDESHELCGRIMGALFVTSYIVSANALHWTVAADKMTAVEGRVVVSYSKTLYLFTG